MTSTKLRVGILGAGDVAQVVHLPTLQLLSHLFTTVAICDISLKTASHCASKFSIPLCTTNPDDLFQNPDIDIIFVLTSDDSHAPFTIAALNAGKHVMLEKPITLSLPSGQTILEAERNAPNGARVFVGYMRRYAHSLKAFKREIATMPAIRYATVRDIIGPNSYFIPQSGCFPVKHFDDISSTAGEERQARLSKLLEEAWEVPYSDLTKDQINYCCLIGSLGSHSLGVMREAFGGLPNRVIATTDHPTWSTSLFDYRNATSPHAPFTTTFELAISTSVPTFDSHITVHGDTKTVSIRYQTPFVKGLDTTVEIDELNEHGEKEHRVLMASYEDAYTAELIELHACMVEGKEIKTSLIDAMEDLKLYRMMMEAYPKGD